MWNIEIKYRSVNKDLFFFHETITKLIKKKISSVEASAAVTINYRMRLLYPRVVWCC